MLDKVERRKGCPECRSEFIYFNGKEVCCTKCSWKEVSKRVDDIKLSTIGEIKNMWGEA